ERRIAATRMRQPVNRLIGDQLTRVAGLLAHRLAVANEVARIVMGGCGVVLSAAPMGEAMLARLRLFAGVELAVAVPFADVAGIVAGIAQERGDGDFLRL